MPIRFRNENSKSPCSSPGIPDYLCLSHVNEIKKINLIQSSLNTIYTSFPNGKFLNLVGVKEATRCGLLYFPIRREFTTFNIKQMYLNFACKFHTSRKKVDLIEITVSFQYLILVHSFEQGSISC